MWGNYQWRDLLMLWDCLSQNSCSCVFQNPAISFFHIFLSMFLPSSGLWSKLGLSLQWRYNGLIWQPSRCFGKMLLCLELASLPLKCLTLLGHHPVPDQGRRWNTLGLWLYCQPSIKTDLFIKHIFETHGSHIGKKKHFYSLYPSCHGILRCLGVTRCMAFLKAEWRYIIVKSTCPENLKIQSLLLPLLMVF